MLTVSESRHMGLCNISRFTSFILACTSFQHLVSHGLLDILKCQRAPVIPGAEALSGVPDLGVLSYKVPQFRGVF